ncbi:ABC transporter permease [Oceanidesulfovibrio indonesiensis]|uniref:Transport permease protein n=1 Tax=Oceanidesulfovibrio indonesiensis TaxID=54767 RepID=A0A7M3MBW4_9BACT|nr:ABC transporter permease [Oceanidesulfovibrio indonesiensis]TVM15798.1 ABC transporter permease [Oceanidesulfovibrio indonesiensis]
MTGVRLSALSWRFLYVWRRNLVTYRRIWRVNFLVPLLEPGFYILAFGLGFSGLVGGVQYAGAHLSYVEFMAPALVATAVMWNSFFETTYTSFVRMYYQKTFDAILATPVSLEEVVVAEIVWAATKSAGAVVVMLLVLTPLGFVNFPSGLWCVPLAFFAGLGFGAVGMFFTGVIPSIDMFNLPIFLFITPMFLFSGTFFPVSGIGEWAGLISLLFPLYHLVELTRLASLGLTESNPLLNLGYLIVFTLLFTWLGLWTMKRRLVV